MRIRPMVLMIGAALVGAGLIASTGIAADAPSGRSERRAAAKAAWSPVGQPVDCVQLNQIDHTDVLDDQTIDFHLRSRKVLRNTLPNSCPRLGFEERFAYKTSIGRLCSLDTITVLDSTGTGVTCGLGKFQPMEKVSQAR